MCTIWDKGIGEYVQAAKIIQSKYPNIKFQLLGPIGVEINAIPANTVSTGDKGYVEYIEETTDVKSYIEIIRIVLPSYREGTSRVLLEAAAVGRPIIASDVAGCREI